MKLHKTLLCCLLIIALCITGISSAAVATAAQSHTAEILKKVGLYSASDESSYISYYDCALLLLAAKGLQNSVLKFSGDNLYTNVNSLNGTQAVLIRDYFIQNKQYGLAPYFGGSVSAVPPASGTVSASNGSKVPSYIVYKAILAGLGYQPGKDFADTKAAIFSYAASVGFQGTLTDTETTTYADWADIFYQALYANTLSGQRLLDYLASINATFKKSAEENGLFTSHSSVFPDFTGGTSIAGSYREVKGKYTEIEEQYSNVSQTAVNSYNSTLKNNGWISQAAFAKKSTSGTGTITENHYTYKKTIAGKEYFAVIIFNVNDKRVTLWYGF